MHGIYYVLVIGITSVYLISSFKLKIFNIESEGYDKKYLFKTFLLMILVGFLNPYGYKMFTYGFKSYFANGLFNNGIYELLAPDFHLLYGKIIIISILIVYIIYFCHFKKILFRHLLLLLGTTYLVFDAV